MGLAICSKAVSAIAGRIWIQESRSGGADFRFTIPELPAGAIPRREDPTPPTAPQPASPSVAAPT